MDAINELVIWLEDRKTRAQLATHGLDEANYIIKYAQHLCETHKGNACGIIKEIQNVLQDNSLFPHNMVVKISKIVSKKHNCKVSKLEYELIRYLKPYLKCKQVELKINDSDTCTDGINFGMQFIVQDIHKIIIENTNPEIFD